jgi:phosphoglucomutase
VAATGLSVRELAQQHWRRFGRHYFARYDYENLSSTAAATVVQALSDATAHLPGRRYGDWAVTQADDFSYRDPVDGSIAVHQGLRVVFGDAARIVLRLSGTGTEGSTLRLYLERYESLETALDWETTAALAPLAHVAEEVVRIGELAGRKTPNVIT